MSRPESRQSRRGGGCVTATSECERPQLRRSYCALADKGLGRRGTLCRSLARGEAIPSSAEIQEFICKLKRERQSIGLDLYPIQQEKAPGTKRPSETEASTDTQSHLDAAEPTAKKPRMSWSHELHQKFVEVLAYLGVDSAVPKAILDLMQVDGLTRENVASHLQKHRIQLKKREHEHAVHQAQAAVPACLDFAKWFAGLQSAVETHNARLTLPYTYRQPPPPTPEMMARAGVRIPDPPKPPELHIDPPPAATCVGSV